MGRRHLYFFFLSSLGRIQRAAKAEEHQHRPKRRVRRLTSEQEGGGNLRMFKPTGRENTELKWTVVERRITTTVKNREPHCGCRVVMVVFIQWFPASKVAGVYFGIWKSHIDLLLNAHQHNLPLTFMHPHPSPELPPFSLSASSFWPSYTFLPQLGALLRYPPCRQMPLFTVLPPLIPAPFTSQTADIPVEKPPNQAFSVCYPTAARPGLHTPAGDACIPWVFTSHFKVLSPPSRPQFLVSTSFLYGHCFLCGTQVASTFFSLKCLHTFFCTLVTLKLGTWNSSLSTLIQKWPPHTFPASLLCPSPHSHPYLKDTNALILASLSYGPFSPALP